MAIRGGGLDIDFAGSSLCEESSSVVSRGLDTGGGESNLRRPARLTLRPPTSGRGNSVGRLSGERGFGFGDVTGLRGFRDSGRWRSATRSLR